MIDVHCHILPAVDDGSRTDEQSFIMLEEEVRQGVTDIVCTPHFRADYRTKHGRIETAFKTFKRKAAERKIPINLYLGQEIYCFNGVEKMIESGGLFTMNGTPYVLMEFSFNRVCDIAETVYTLKNKGYIPIVAHIERYFYADIALAEEVKETGGLIQINAESLCGFFNFKYKRKVMTLLQAGLVDFVASDFHFKRKNRLAKAYAIVKKKFGEETAEKLFVTNAKPIVNG